MVSNQSLSHNSSFRSLLRRVSVAAACLLGGSVATGQIQIPASQATTTSIPGTPGDGVFIEVFNGIGGGSAPTPAQLVGRTPTGTTLSPRIDFPFPGSVINVGNSFTSFFASTAFPPDVIRNTPAFNFILRHTFLLKVTQDLDRNTSTPGIDIRLDLGSDDGFDLRVGTVFIGSTGDRGFGYSNYDVRFEGPGLYPVTMLFAANSVGASGLELSWVTSRNGGNREIIPQSFMYLGITGCTRQFDFESVAVGTSLTDQYRTSGAIFRTISGSPVVTNARPTEFVPVSGTQVIADPASPAPQPPVLELTFVLPGTSTRAQVDFASYFIIDAETIGARVEAFNAAGNQIFTENYNAGGATQQQASIARTGIAKILFYLGSGTDTSAIDNLCFSEPYAQPADLAVAGPAPVGTANFGASIPLEWTVTNTGSLSAAGAWSDRAYLSTDQTLDASDVAITPALAGTSPLAGDAQYTRTPNATLPLSAGSTPGVYWIIVRADDANTLFEPNEANNVSVLGQINLTLPPLPDLQITDITSSSTYVADSFIDVNWTGRNLGPAPATGNWIDRVYLSTNNTFEAGSDLLLVPDVAVNGPIPANGAYQRTQRYRLPLTAGQFWLIVVADAANQVLEIPNENNNVLVDDAPIIIAPAPQPDLVVTSLTPPPNAPPGASVPITYTITNNGAGPAVGPWQETIIGTLDNTLGNGNDLTLSAVSYNLTLRSGESVSRTTNVTVPVGIPAGGYFAAVCVDALNQISEADEGNNCRIAPVCVNCNLPDLTVSNVTAPTSVLAGGSIQVSWQVNNAGTGPTQTGFLDRVVLTPQTGPEVILGELRRTTALANGANYAANIQVSIPRELSGLFTVCVRTDALNEVSEPGFEANNRECSPTGTQVDLPPGPDLVVASVAPRSATALFGSPITVDWVASNEGNQPASGNWSDRMFLSRDEILDGSDVPLVAVPTPSTPLSGGGSTYASFGTATLPLSSSLAPGQYRIVIQTDATGIVNERLESNNTRASAAFQVDLPPLPDLIVASVATPPSGNVNDNVDIIYTIRNSGTAPTPAGARWIERVYISTDSIIGNDTLVLAEPITTETLATGADATRVRSIRVPNLGLAYYVIVCIDTQDTFVEVDRNNNCQTSVGPGTIFRPDVVASNVVAPPAAIADGTIEISWTVTNAGRSVAQAPFVDAIELVRGSQVITLGSYVHDQPIAPNGGTLTITRTFPVPGRLLGLYTARVRLDTSDALLETGPTSNNTAQASSPTDVSQPDRADLTIATVQGPTNGFIGTPGQATWTVVNTSPAITATGPWVDRLIARQIDGPAVIELSVAFRSESLPPLGTYTSSAQFSLPSIPGRYTFEVMTDSADSVNEGVGTPEANNSLAAPGEFRTRGYVVTTIPNINEALAGTPVTVSGTATDLETGALLTDTPVAISYSVRDIQRVISSRTDGSGMYSVPLLIASSEAGIYQLRSGPPALIDPIVRGTFTLHSITSPPTGNQAVVFPGAPLPTVLTIPVRNPGDAPLTSFAVEITGAPTGLIIQNVDSGSTLLPGQTTREVRVSLAASAGTANTTGTLAFRFSTAQGAQSLTTIPVSIQPPAASLTISPSSLDVAMLRSLPNEERQTVVQLSVTNQGGTPASNVQVLVPPAPWLRLASPAAIGTLAPGQTTNVVINLVPPANLPLGPYDGSLVIRSENGGDVIIPFRFTNVSDGVGTLAVITSNEFTYYGTGNPPLAGANIRVTNATNNELIASGSTNDQGLLLFENLPEGSYYVEGSAPSHVSSRDLVEIRRGEQTILDAFLSRQVVRYSWRVDPIQIDDRYRFTLDTVFETNVPIPVVSIDPPFVDLAALPSESTTVTFIVTNHGLIEARDVGFQVQSSTSWELIPLVSDIGVIPPLSSVRVPVVINRRSGLAGGCDAPFARVAHSLICGVLRTYYTPISWGVPGSLCGGGGCCGGGGGGGGGGGCCGGGGGGGGGGGIPYLNGPFFDTTPTCEPPCEEGRCLIDECNRLQGTASAALYCQLACLANTCTENTPEWIKRTNATTAKNKCPGAPQPPTEQICQNIPGWIPATVPVVNIPVTSNDICMLVNGVWHFLQDLIPAWEAEARRTNCNGPDDQEHNDFLLQDLVPCMLGNPHLSAIPKAIAAVSVPIGAAATREWIQWRCRQAAAANNGGGPISPGDTNLSPPAPPARGLLFSPDLAAAGTIRVTGAGDSAERYLFVGESVQLTFTRELGAGMTQDITDAGTGRLVYAAGGNVEGSVTVSETGVMTINRATSPLSNAPSIVLIVVKFGEDDWGVGQFAILPQDTDGDGIADYAEIEAGLDETTPNDARSDLDADGLTDAYEIIYGTSPFDPDSNDNGIPDGIEFYRRR